MLNTLVVCLQNTHTHTDTPAIATNNTDVYRNTNIVSETAQHASKYQKEQATSTNSVVSKTVMMPMLQRG